MGEQLAKTFIAAVANRDLAAWAAMFTDDATYAIPEVPEPIRGREALDAMSAMFFEDFPDMAFEVRTVTEQSNIVVLEAATKGTFTGPMATPGQGSPNRPLVQSSSQVMISVSAPARPSGRVSR